MPAAGPQLPIRVLLADDRPGMLGSLRQLRGLLGS